MAHRCAAPSHRYQGTGMHATIGILGALMNRERSGRGARLEVSLFDTAVGFLGYFLQGYWQRGTEPQRAGSGHESLCPYQAFETRDKPLILGVANDALWLAFCDAAGVPGLAGDPRFATGAGRVRHRRETVEAVAMIMRGKTRGDWMRLLEARGIPCSPVHTLGELDAHPQTMASEMILRYRNAKGRELKCVATPLRVDGKRSALRNGPPSAWAGQFGDPARSGLRRREDPAMDRDRRDRQRAGLTLPRGRRRAACG